MFQDVDIPEVAKLNFDSCEFDAEFEQVCIQILLLQERKTFLNVSLYNFTIQFHYTISLYNFTIQFDVS